MHDRTMTQPWPDHDQTITGPWLGQGSNKLEYWPKCRLDPDPTFVSHPDLHNIPWQDWLLWRRLRWFSLRTVFARTSFQSVTGGRHKSSHRDNSAQSSLFLQFCNQWESLIFPPGPIRAENIEAGGETFLSYACQPGEEGNDVEDGDSLLIEGLMIETWASIWEEGSPWLLLVLCGQ